MALADPQSLTIGGVATPLPRTGLTLDKGEFRDATGQTVLTVSHDGSKNRRRHVVKVQKTSIVSDPLVPAQNVPTSFSAHVVIDVPVTGVTAAQSKELATALTAWLTAARIEQVIGGES